MQDFDCMSSAEYRQGEAVKGADTAILTARVQLKAGQQTDNRDSMIIL